MAWATSLCRELQPSLWVISRKPGGSGEMGMLKLRMRTKFLLSMLLISAGLTCTSLLLVRHSVQKQVKRETLCGPAKFRRHFPELPA